MTTTEVDVLSVILLAEDENNVHLAEEEVVSAAAAAVVAENGTTTNNNSKIVLTTERGEEEERDDLECIAPGYIMLENNTSVDDDAEELVHAVLRARTIKKRHGISIIDEQ